MVICYRKGDNMKYPKHTIYKELYKRYFKKGVLYLIEQASIKENDKVLDLCGGNGRLSMKLIKLTNDVTYVDQEKEMIPDNLEDFGIKVINKSIKDFLDTNTKKYDKVFCEQAINYWLLDINPKMLSNIFNKDGLFIFNTFCQKPPIKPLVREYCIDDINYVEISYLVGKKVNHVQIRENYEPHFTVFDWISKEEYLKILSPYFDIQVIENEKSSLYVCRKK